MNFSGEGDVEVVEIVLGDEDGVVEDGMVIERSVAARGRPPLVTAVLLLLGLVAWQVLAGGSDETTGAPLENDQVEEVEPAAAPDEPARPEAPPTTGPLRSPPGPAEELAEEAVGGPADEPVGVLAETAFPLFPGSPGLTLVIRTRDEVVLLDADTGTVGRISSAQDSSPQDFGPFGNTMALLGDAIAVQGTSSVVIYPLDGGGSIDMGNVSSDQGATGILALEGRLILISFSEFLSVRQFDETGTEIGEPLALVHPFAIPDPFGHLNAPGGVYELVPDGFRRISSDTLVVSGPNHLLTVVCDESLACGHSLTNLETGSSREVLLDDDIEQFINIWSASLSPTGRYLQYQDHRKAGRTIIDLVNGETIDAGVINNQSNGPPPRVWTPDSKYLVESFRRDSLLIAESATGDVRTIDLAPLGIEGIRSGLLVFERP
ncbi:MAG: hypothetical protein V3V01_20660 [Acidimicrobiales bacterium]